ncbi:MAG: hypothetical protein LBP87_13830, partial [Planctomycetaceae bacterium]|nr:hypothetical protein [Planctomycetaceae bacterium]
KEKKSGIIIPCNKTWSATAFAPRHSEQPQQAAYSIRLKLGQLQEVSIKYLTSNSKDEIFFSSIRSP